MFSRIAVVSCLGVLMVIGGLSSAAPDPDAVVGVWLTDGGGSKIEIYKKDAKYYGKIVWLKEPNVEEGKPEAGKPKRDANNPDPVHKTDPILGLQLLRDFEFDGTDKWGNGTIYDPETGKTYKCTMKIAEGGKLDVHGYIGIPAFGRSTIWTRDAAPVDAKQPAATK